MADRRALVVATSDYEDPKLRELRAPGADAEALTKVLGDPAIGAFEVSTLPDPHEDELRRRVSSFFRAAARDDFLLLHMACHGVKDDDGKLYFAASDTQLSDLAATAVRADFVNEAMHDSRSAQIVLLLDCCYSGAFSKGMTPRADSSVQLRDAFHGQGMAVLSASEATEYAWEGDDVTGEGVSSVFTRAVVEGLENGSADLNRDGQVSVDDLYEYVRTRLEKEGSKQTPRKWSDLSGDLYIALNPRAGEELTLPAELVSAIENPIASIRLGAIQELTRLARGRHVGYANAARSALERLATDDSRSVSEAAEDAIASIQPVTVVPGPVGPTIIDLDVDEDEGSDLSEDSQEDSGERGETGTGTWWTRTRLIGVAVGALVVAAVGIILALSVGGSSAPRTIGQVSGSSLQTLKVDVPSTAFGIGAGGIRASAVWALEPHQVFAYDPGFSGTTITRQVPLPGRPLDIGVNGGLVWVVTAPGDGQQGWLVEIDPSDASVMNQVPFPKAVARVSAGNNFVWVLRADGTDLYKVGVSGASLLQKISTGGHATDVAVGPNSVFLVDTTDRTLTQMNSDGARMGSITLKSSPARVSSGGNFVWVTQPSSGSVTLVALDPSGGFDSQQAIHLGGRPTAIVYANGAAWITDASSSAVDSVSASGGHARTTIGVGGQPLDVFASHVPNAQTDTIYVLVAT
jgi:caspase domain-containing protein